MILNQLIAPVQEPITQTEVENQLRIVDLSAESDAIELFISAVRQQCESVTRRALIYQKWSMTLDFFPLNRDKIEIPLPPLQTVDSIVYIDGNGDSQTLDSSLYRVVAGQSAKCQPGYVIPVYGAVWPVALNDYAAVTINFSCGYGPIAPATSINVPKAIMQWILINVANLYENRETAVIDKTSRLSKVELPTIADGLIDDFRVPML
jgi:uncharacterized phiE125 gp8 family phage protein